MTLTLATKRTSTRDTVHPDTDDLAAPSAWGSDGALLSAGKRPGPTRPAGEVVSVLLRRVGAGSVRGSGRRCPSWPDAAGGGGSSESAPDLLAKAKKTLDATKTVHFVLGSSGAPSSGTVLTGGDGDIARPSSFQGTLKVTVVRQQPSTSR